MPKSKVRKKNPVKAHTPQAKFDPRDPTLGAILVERKWRYLGEDEVADCWDFPGLADTGMQTFIFTQPFGYVVDYFRVGDTEPFKSTTFRSRDELIEQLDFSETWGRGIVELRNLLNQNG